MIKNTFLALIILLVLATSCSTAPTPTQTPGPVTLTVMTHDSFAVSEEVVKAFEDEFDAKLVFLKSGDTGAALNRAILVAASANAGATIERPFRRTNLAPDRVGFALSEPDRPTAAGLC